MLSIEGLTGLEDERFAGFLLAGSFGPTLAALAMAGFTGGGSSMINLLKSLFRVRVNRRGFLQPRLQGAAGTAATAIIVGLVWAFWHLPVFRFADFRNGLELPQFIVLYPLSTILVAFSMGHLWRWSHGSVFVAVCFHAVLNTTAANLTRDNWWDFQDLTQAQIYLAILAVFALTAVGTQLLSRLVFHQRERGSRD